MGNIQKRDYSTFKGVSFRERVLAYIKKNGLNEAMKHVKVSIAVRIRSKIRSSNLKKMYEDIISKEYLDALCLRIHFANFPYF